jgi:hypothetical protein
MNIGLARALGTMKRISRILIVCVLTLATQARAQTAGGDDLSFDGPLTIEHGGTYRGRWLSNDPAVPAILLNTAEPVIIEQSILRGRGHLIATGIAHANVIVRNTRAIASNPNVEGLAPGRFFTGEDCARVQIEHCELERTAGIYLLGYGGDFSADQTFKIRFNRAANIDGRKSDGHGGFLDFNRRQLLAGGTWEKGFVETQFVQLDKVRHVPGIEIGWNEVLNQPGNSRVEDNISIYLSSGTPDSPIRIHDNLIRGAYTIHPSQRDTRDATYRHDWSYSGGGIMLGDGSANTPVDAAAFVEAVGNVVISTTNYGIATSAGHDLIFHDNRIISCGRLPDGRPIAGQNVGAYIWDSHKDAVKTPPSFHSNVARDNWIGWMKADRRNDSWHPDAGIWAENHTFASPITLQTEENEFTQWVEKLKAGGFAVGAAALAPQSRPAKIP